MVTLPTRKEGWERRLNAVLADAITRPYVLGEHDCFRLACRVLEALTGVDRWPDFAGYRTEREALAKIAARGSNFEAAGDWFFGAENRVTPLRARRGDIVAICTPDDGKKHLGVCRGADVVMMAHDGLIARPLSRDAVGAGFYLCAWRVG